MHIKIEAEHWTERLYVHPGSGELEDMDNQKISELEAEYSKELEYKGMDTGFNMNISMGVTVLVATDYKSA